MFHVGFGGPSTVHQGTERSCWCGRARAASSRATIRGTQGGLEAGSKRTRGICSQRTRPACRPTGCLCLPLPISATPKMPTVLRGSTDTRSNPSIHIIRIYGTDVGPARDARKTRALPCGRTARPSWAVTMPCDRGLRLWRNCDRNKRAVTPKPVNPSLTISGLDGPTDTTSLTKL